MDRARFLAAALGAPLVVTGTALAEPGDSPDTIIVTAPGGRIDLDDAHGLDAADLTRAGVADLFGALGRGLPGVSLQDGQGNPFQPNIVYRGFTISPLQGVAQGLAVYVDGVRFNQPFGDTAPFDLLPQAAIADIAIKDASPIYGLNALGGALVVATKTGRDAPGITLALSGGSYGRIQGSAEAGWSDGPWSAYVAVEGFGEDGWRRFSPSERWAGLVDVGHDGAAAGIHAKFAFATSDLTGNGAAPIELLAAGRGAVFTHPDNTRNDGWRVSLHPWWRIGDHTRLEASLYWQQFRQRTFNGDAAEIEECDDEPVLCLEAGDEEIELTDTDGDEIDAAPVAFGYGFVNRSRTRTDGGGALVQLADARPLLGGDNRLTLGFSYDAARTRFASSSEVGALTETRGVEGLGPIVALDSGLVAPVSLVTRNHYWGVFLAEELPITDRLTLEVGLRWNDALVVLADQIGTALNGRHRFRRFNPGAELDWQVTDGLDLRFGYAETNRAPTPAELSCADENAPCSLTNFFLGDPPLRQVVARSFELGAGGRFTAGGWQARWDIGGWHANNDDDITFIAASVRGRGFFQNVGRTRRQGVDATLTMTHRGSRGSWRVHAGYTFTDATFRAPLLLGSPENPLADADGRIAVARGDRLPGVPRHRGLLSVDYDGTGFPGGLARGWSLGGDLQAQSGQRFFGDENNVLPDTGTFAIVNLRGRLDLNRRLTLFAEVANLFDARRSTFGLLSELEIPLAEAPEASDPRFLGPGQPRRVTLGFRAGF